MIMYGMGLSLRFRDFKRVMQAPLAVSVGLFCQLVLLPAIGFLIAVLTPLPPIWSVGLVLLSACPGGSTSNVITLLARGDVALSLTLTALSSSITIFTLPLISNLAVQVFLGESAAVQLPFLSSLMQIILMTIAPVVLGMITRVSAPRFARKTIKPIRSCAIVFLSIVILGIILQASANDFIATVLKIGWIVLLMNAITMLLGFLIASFLNVSRRRAVAITIEVGIQNGGLAIAIASSATFLNSPEMALPAAIYSILMFFTGIGFARWSNRVFLLKRSPLPVNPIESRQQQPVSLK